MRRLPELLAPAGDMEALIAAVEAGADAIYVGGKLYGARSYAKNFDLDEMRRAVAYCHLNGVKLYVTMNTLLYTSELVAALEFARELYVIGVDALIVADLGLVSALRRYLPDFELHASTQMSVHNSDGAKMAAALGCSRVVLARELSETDMAATVAASPIECEVFLHGALCVCHSGQCLFSSMVGGRSGNRGECAQPCRLPFYEGKREYYPLSLSDLSLAHHIPSLVNMGVASLKIEGRMKSPEYVYTVTSIYRRLLDECRASTKREDEILRQAFSRGGFTDGYFRGEHGAKMTGVRSEADKILSREMKTREFLPRKTRVDFDIEIRAGEPARLTATVGDRRVTVLGDIPEAAKNAPLDSEGVATRLAKLGNTFLEAGNISVALDDGLNLSPASLNRLRRAATESIELPLREARTVEVGEALNLREGYLSEYRCKTNKPYRRTAIVYNSENIRVAIDTGYFDKVYIPLHKLDEARGSDFGVSLPPVIVESERCEVMEMLRKAKERGITDCTIGNIGHIPMVKEAGLSPSLDFRANVLNSVSAATYSALGFGCVTLSPELTIPEAEKIGGRVIVYGRIPLMLTERCFVSENFGCRGCDRSTFTDRRGAKFPILREYKHRNIIFNSAITYIADKPDDRTRVKFEHYIFSVESGAELTRIVGAYKRGERLPLDAPMRRIGKRRVDK